MEDTTMATKKEIYDEQIRPLMTKIIAICSEHKIGNLCTFSLGDDDEGEGLMCTTAMATEEFEPPERLTLAEAAKYLGVHRNTLRRWGRIGKLPEYRHPMNNYRLFKVRDLDKLLRRTAESAKELRRRANKIGD